MRFVFVLVLFSGSVVLPIVLLKYFPQFWPHSFYVVMAIVTLAVVSLGDKEEETLCSHCRYQILHHSPYDELGRKLMEDGRLWYKPSSILWTVTKDNVIHTLSPQNRFGTFPYRKEDVNHNWCNSAQLTHEEAMWLTLEMRPELTYFI